MIMSRDVGERLRHNYAESLHEDLRKSADTIAALERQLAEAQTEIERLRKLEKAFMRGDLKHI
jgi:hypothetical protein